MLVYNKQLHYLLLQHI